MMIEILDKMLLQDVQDGFQRCYPNLWIDFFYDHNLPGTLHVTPEKIKPGTPISRLTVFKKDVLLDIDSNKTVTQLEKHFLDELGVQVKVMRKSGNVFVGTPYTNDWTLDAQNAAGGQIKF